MAPLLHAHLRDSTSRRVQLYWPHTVSLLRLPFAYSLYAKLHQRWWDEQKDADSGNMWQSSMWGPDAFGGNGTGSDLCVIDGRFSNYTLHIGPGDEDTDYCLRRAWDNENAIANANSTALNNCNAYNTFSPWWDCISNIPHKGIHTYIGGVVRISFEIMQYNGPFTNEFNL